MYIIKDYFVKSMHMTVHISLFIQNNDDDEYQHKVKP
jgi:hypothetical protein